MRHHRRGLLPAAVVGALCLVQAGCQGIFHHPSTSSPRQPAGEQAAAATLRPGTEVAWTVTGSDQPKGGTSGRSYVQADGKMEMGPFGAVAVGGMTVPRAEAAVAKQMRHYVHDPKVELRVVQARPPAPPAVQPVQALEAAQAAPAGVVQWSSDADEGLAFGNGGSQPRPGAGVQLVSSRPAGVVDGPVLIVGDESQKKGTKKGQTGGSKATPEKGPEELGAPRTLPGQTGAPLGGEPGCGGADQVGPGGPAPNECNRVTMPPYRIAPPDILLIETIAGLKTQKVEGQHLVRPDGTVGLGIYGSVYITGMTLDQARVAVAQAIFARLRKPKGKEEEGPTLKQVIDNLSVDVLAYNSKVYYVITNGAGNGEQVNRLPFTGNETVLDAIGLNPVRPGIFGLSPVSSRHHIWVARPDCHGREEILPVDWIGITQRGQTETNYQIMPGDRVYVQADKLRTIYTAIDKFLAPIERVLGVTLLASETVNSIRSGATSTVP
jgi:polysaccharide export outer membrane protein